MKKFNVSRRFMALMLALVLSLTCCMPAFAAKPTTKNVKAKVTSVTYSNSSMKTYFKVKFTNNSSKKIKSAKVVLYGTCDETVKRTKTVTLNLKAHKSKIVKVYFTKLIDKPEDCKVKIKSMKY